MKQFTLSLGFTQQRPVIDLNNFTALLDTGAYFPVWTDDETVLTDELDAKLVKKSVSFTGFGGLVIGNLYQFMFQIGNLVFPSLPIITNSDVSVPFSMILSATMFKGLIYEIDDSSHKFNVTIPDKESVIRNLKIESSDGKLHILYSSEGLEPLKAFL